MDLNPDDVTQYLEGAKDLASTAEGAPDELVERIRTLGRPTFSGPDEVVADLESSPTAG